MSKKKCPECPAGEKWAVPYADFLSLLLALFIALWAISSSDAYKIKALTEAFINIFDYPITQPLETPEGDTGEDSDGRESDDPNTLTPLSNIEDNPINVPVDSPGGLLEQVDSGSYLKLPTSILFEIGEARITNSDNFTYIDRLVSIINKYPRYVHLDVRGYTDNQEPPLGSQYRDNFELSAARANNVMRELIQKGIEPERISISAYGPYDNAVDNDTLENRKLNNRVQVFFFVSRAKLPEVNSILERQGGVESE